MLLKKTEHYSSIWKSCDEPRGEMDASRNELHALLPSVLDRAFKGEL